jgi:hypothetical protein
MKGSLQDLDIWLLGYWVIWVVKWPIDPRNPRCFTVALEEKAPKHRLRGFLFSPDLR